jgi:hypothetical protein
MEIRPMKRLITLVMCLMFTISSFASTVGHESFRQILDEMNFDLSQAGSETEREQIAAMYEERIKTTFSMMSPSELSDFREELFLMVPERLKTDLEQLFRTVDFDKLTKDEQIRIIQTAARNQYQKGAAYEGELVEFLITPIIIGAAFYFIFAGMTCGPGHNCDGNNQD